MDPETTQPTIADPAPPPDAPQSTGTSDPPAAHSGVGGGKVPVASTEPPPATPPASEPSDTAATEDRIAALEAELAAEREKAAAAADAGSRVEALEGRLAEQRKHMFGQALERMSVKSEMREYARLALGDLDPSTTAGREKLEKWIADHPSVIDSAPTADVAAQTAARIDEAVKLKGGASAKFYSASQIESGLRDLEKRLGGVR